MNELFLKILKREGACLIKLYCFPRHKYETFNEIIKNETPEYRLEVAHSDWRNDLKITEDEFKKLLPYFEEDDIRVLPFDCENELLVIFYEILKQ